MKATIFLLFSLLQPAVPTLEWKKADGPSEVIYRVHSIYIYNFIKEIQWPASAATGNFTIGMVGSSEMEAELRKLAATRTTNSRKILVKAFKTIGEVDKSCHIIYLGADYSDGLSTVLQKVRGTSVLVITHKDGAARFGSLINFVSEGGRPKFEMNLTAFEKSGLKYTQTLKSVAITLN